MDEKVLLQAISDMMDQKLAINNETLEKKLDQKLEPISHRLEKLEQKTDNLKSEIMQEINIVLESGLEKQIKAIAEGHANILERLPEADEIDSLRSRVRTLERVVTKHIEESKLEKAN